MSNELVLHTSCVDPDRVGGYGESIHEMMGSIYLNEISNSRFIMYYAKKFGIVELALQVANQERHVGFKNDFSVSCYTSFFQGIPCVIIRASHIEYIFIDPSHKQFTVRGKSIIKRSDVAEGLKLHLEGLDSWAKAKHAVHKKEALISFIRENIDAITRYNLLAESILPDADGIKGADLKKIDQQLVLSVRSMEPFK